MGWRDAGRRGMTSGVGRGGHGGEAVHAIVRGSTAGLASLACHGVLEGRVNCM